MTTDGAVFCRGVEADAAELAAFAARTFQATFSADNNPEDMQAHLVSTYGPRQQSQELLDPNVTTILCRREDELLAYAQVRRGAPPPCVTHDSPVELHRFYMDKATHGSGLATRLMQEVCGAAREFGGRHLWLGVWERNPRAIAFYNKVGFANVGSTIYSVGPDEQTDRVLVMSLNPQ